MSDQPPSSSDQLPPGLGAPRPPSITDILDGKTTGPATLPIQQPTPNEDPFFQDPFAQDPGLLLGPAPRKGQAPGSYGLDVEALLLAANNAARLSGDLHRLVAAIDHGTPPGTPGFATGFQAGEVNRLWGTKVSWLSQGMDEMSKKILKTRWAYQAAEADNSSLFQGL